MTNENQPCPNPEHPVRSRLVIRADQGYDCRIEVVTHENGVRAAYARDASWLKATSQHLFGFCNASLGGNFWLTQIPFSEWTTFAARGALICL